MEHILEENMEYTIDSREVKPGFIFVALKGERDGNDFAEDAFKKGASKLILSRKPDFRLPKEKYIVVLDTLQYLHSSQLKNFIYCKKKE